jgi:hypothetical protein
MESAAGYKERGSPGHDDTVKAAGIATLLQAAPYPKFRSGRRQPRALWVLTLGTCPAALTDLFLTQAKGLLGFCPGQAGMCCQG